LIGNEAIDGQIRDFPFSRSSTGLIGLQFGGIGVKNLRQTV
jgi:hypothetical protein